MKGQIEVVEYDEGLWEITDLEPAQLSELSLALETAPFHLSRELVNLLFELKRAVSSIDRAKAS